MSSSSKKNSKSSSKSNTNGSSSGSHKQNQNRSSNTSPSLQQQQQHQQTPPPPAAPASVPVPPKPAVNAWSKPLQTKAPPKTSSTSSTATTANKNVASAPATVSASSSSASTPATANPPPGYKPRDAATAQKQPAPQTPQPSQTVPTKHNVGPPGFVTNAEEEAKNRDRALQVFLLLLGQSVKCYLKNGLVLEGVLHTATPFEIGEQYSYVYLLKRCRVVAGKDDSIEMGATVTLPMRQVVQLHAQQVKLASLIQQKPGASNSFANSTMDGFIDSEIAGTRNSSNPKDRSLQAAGSVWTSAGAGPVDNGSLDTKYNKRAEALAGPGGLSSSLKGSIGTWDQFQANEALFNVRATYDETVYTTPLDRSQLDASKIKRAEQLAKEIESAPSSNIHLQQERNQSIAGDYDEEDLHSGVLQESKKTSKKEIAIKETKKEPAPQPPKKQDQPAGAPMNYAKAVQQKEVKPVKEEIQKDEIQNDIIQKDEIQNDECVETLTQPVSETEKNDIQVETEDQEELQPVLDEPGEIEEEEEEQVAEVPEEPKLEKSVVVEETTAKPLQEESSVATAATTVSEEKSQNSEKPKSKLNANAKEFTLNINAKSFTPSFSTPPPPPPPPESSLPQQHLYVPQHFDMMAPPPQYMQANAHMGQHGMMHMMSPQYGAVRYAQGPYGMGMEQQMLPPPMAQQPQHMQGHQQQGHLHHQMVGATMPMQPPPPPPPPPPPQQPQPQQQHQLPSSGAATPATASSPVPPEVAGHDQDSVPRTADPDSLHLLQPGSEQAMAHGPQQPHPMQALPHGMHPQGAFYGAQMVQQRGPVPYGQPRYMPGPPTMYRPQMYAPMGPPNVMAARPPYYGGPNPAQMPPGPYIGYGGYGGGEGDLVVVDGGYGRGGAGVGGRGGGRHPGGRAGRHPVRGGRHHTGRGGRPGGNNTASGRGRMFGGGSGSGRSTPEDGGTPLPEQPPPPPPANNKKPDVVPSNPTT